MLFQNPWSERSRRVKEFLKGVPPREVIEQFRELEDISRISYFGAVQRYEKKYYDETVLNAVSAVEFALAIKLDSEIDEKDKIITKFGKGFGALIDLAKDKVLQGESYDNAKTLNKYRNAYLHPINLLAFLIRIHKFGLNNEAIAELEKNVINIMKDLKAKESASTFIRLNPYFQQARKKDPRLEVLDKFQSLKWVMGSDSQEFLEKELFPRFIAHQVELILSSKGRIRMVYNYAKAINPGVFREFVAKDVLNITRSLLDTLQIL